jgi:hypothetical protein
MPEDEVEEIETDTPVGDDLLELISDEDGNEILRTTGGTVIEDEDEEGEDEDAEVVVEDPPAESEVPAPDAPTQEDAPVRADAVADIRGEVEVPKYNGFSVRPDGLGIYERAYEDANSPEAEALIYGEIDEDTGEVISAGIGEREYARRCGSYEVSKMQYAQQEEGKIQATLSRAVTELKSEAESLYPNLAKRFNVTEEDAKEFAPIYDRAIQLIDEERMNRARQYAAAGYPGETAFLLANRDVLSVKGVLNMAFKSAAMEMEDTYDEIKWKLREKGKGNHAPEAKVEPVKEERLIPPQTTTATSVPVKQAPAKAEKVDLRGIPRAALEIARMTGRDPRTLLD